MMGKGTHLRCRTCQKADPMSRRVWPTDHHITRLLVDSLVSLNAISRLCGGEASNASEASECGVARPAVREAPGRTFW